MYQTTAATEIPDAVRTTLGEIETSRYGIVSFRTSAVPSTLFKVYSVVGGDALVPEISAASILAKVERDRQMMELDRLHPEYGFAKHKGYPTKLHYELIAQYGIQPFYRRSFLKKQGYWPEGK